MLSDSEVPHARSRKRLICEARHRTELVPHSRTPGILGRSVLRAERERRQAHLLTTVGVVDKSVVDLRLDSAPTRRTATSRPRCHRLRQRRWPKTPIGAVAVTILTAAHHLPTNGTLQRNRGAEGAKPHTRRAPAAHSAGNGRSSFDGNQSVITRLDSTGTVGRLA